MLKAVKKNVIKLILVSIGALVLGLVLIFIFSNFVPGDPILAYLPEGKIDWELYEQMKQHLGFNDPMFIQFIRYVFDLLTGNLGVSFSIARGQPVFELLADNIPLSIGFPLLPLIFGLIAGIFLGILSIKVRNRFVKLLIQILIVLGISMPMLFIGMWFQYILAFQLGLFPTTGDLFLPSCILFVLTLFLTTRQVRSNYLKPPEEKSIWSNSLHILFYSSILIVSITLLETIFNLPGFFSLLITAFNNADYWVIRSGLSGLVLLLVIILLLSNLTYTIYNHYLGKSQSRRFIKFFGRNEQIIEEGARYEFDSDQKFKDFTIYRLKSPLTIIGLVIVGYAIIVAIFPQLLTPLTVQEAFGVYPGSWGPPSPANPLGKTKFGRDVLALLAYGISTSVKVSFLTVLIGIVLGTSFGYLSKVHKIVKELVLGFMVILFIVPSFFMILIFFGILGGGVGITTGILAAYVIPIVTFLISEGDYSFKLTAKKLVAYLPLFMGFNLLIFESLAFFGYTDYRLITLGINIAQARAYLFIAPWASLWSGLAVFVLIMGFFSLHYGLKEPIPIAGRL